MKRELLIIILIFLMGSMFALDIQHVSPQTYIPGEDLQLMLEVQQGLDDISELTLSYRIKGETRWNKEKAAQKTPGAVYYWAMIPAKYLGDNELEYYFTAELKQGATQNFPAQDGITPNYKLVPKGMTGELSNGFVLLSEGEAANTDEGYLLAVSFFELEDELDPKSIEVWVGGRNVTADAQISPPTIMYRDDKPQVGIKKAVIKAKLGSKDIHSPIWATEILPGVGKAARPFTYRGTVNFASNYYSSSLDEDLYSLPRSDAAAWTDLYGTYGILNMQANLYVSSLEKSNKQPVNRYTFGLQIPHVDVFAGDYSPMISQYTMYNKNIKGVYAKLYSRWASLLFAHGQSVRKTTSEINVSPIAGEVLKSGTFKQEAIGGRFQLGNENEVMMGINFSRHRDIVSSLEKEYYMLSYTPAGESVADTLYSITPRDNLVLSTDLRINIPAQNILLGAEIAGSLMNKNILPGAMTADEIEAWTGEEIPLDPSDFSDYIIINKNMEPFLPSKANLAWTAYLRTMIWNNFLSVQYSQTGPSFNAFGASTQMNDSSNLSVTDQINIYRYLVLSGGLNITEDNLMGHKSETNKFNNWFVQSIIRIPKAPYLKIAYYNNNGENEDNPDIDTETIPYTRSSHNLALGIGYNVTQIAMVPTQFDISYKMGGDDSKLNNVLNSDNENSSINFTMFNRFATLPLTTQFSLSLNDQKLKIADRKNKNQSILFGAGYGIWENKIRPFANYRIVSVDQDPIKTNYGYLTLGVEAYPIKDLSITTDLGLNSFSSDEDAIEDYNNTTWRVFLTQRF